MTLHDAVINHATRAVLDKFPGLANAHAITKTAIEAYNAGVDRHELTPNEKALIDKNLED